jgi:hypothetical protein
MSVPVGYETFKCIESTLVTCLRLKLYNFEKDFPPYCSVSTAVRVTWPIEAMPLNAAAV